MLNSRKQFIAVLILVIAGFAVGIYLQDLKHQESTQAAWQANRSNLARFNKIRNHMINMDSTNWSSVQDSVWQELDSFKILRFRREFDSLANLAQKN